MQIDLKKFIESMYKYGQHNLSYSNAMVYALADQGYKIDDEHHVVPIEEIKGNNGGISPNYDVNEDERIRKWLVRTLKALNSSSVEIDGAYEMMLPSIAYLEKQGNLMGALQEANKKISELVEENYYLKEEQKGKLVLTPEAYERVLKLGEKQGEQKPADKVEVKQVDLEKETKKWWKERLHLNPENQLWMDTHQSIVFAKHFFELGLKAQKREELC